MSGGSRAERGDNYQRDALVVRENVIVPESDETIPPTLPSPSRGKGRVDMCESDSRIPIEAEDWPAPHARATS